MKIFQTPICFKTVAVSRSHASVFVTCCGSNLPKRLADGPSGLNKRLHPHSLRHTTAVYLLKSGVDVATISQWLGHATLNTTIRYARADMDLKRQALSQVFPEILGAPKGGRVRLDGTEITTWLRGL